MEMLIDRKFLLGTFIRKIKKLRIHNHSVRVDKAIPEKIPTLKVIAHSSALNSNLDRETLVHYHSIINLTTNQPLFPGF
ncbi:MAG: hypothetical protein HN368_24545 [Spirochaetales bacterium]|jgi:hypothetical protein|nr:hypothetical protein [Spirochaetales bacterium]